MAKNGQWRVCACGCKRKFRPKVSTQRYFNRACKNRAGSARLRERARGYSELSAEAHGSLGES